MSHVASLEIVGYEGLYWITKDGHITSKIRKGVPVGVVNPILGNRGYLYVGLSKAGQKKNFTIHRLIARHFISNPHNYRCVNHVNGVKTDNRIENLEWCTSSQNNTHAYATGLKIPHGPVGEKNHTAKLNADKIQQAQSWVKLGFPKWAIAQNLGVNRSTLHRALTKQTWRHL